ncbi:HEAT repeat domain-containing protein, partial [Actinoplanes philippinensis]|uniref:HEAT repeat domain-containing protein n=1 Tax=Actinoplanes philippinensis TaxID=35752 RepID=UPI0033FBC0E1
MGRGKARRIAGRAHRGQLFGDGLFTGHLERVAGHVAAAGGSAAQVQAAWLYATPDRGVTPLDLYRAGVPAAVVRLVEAVQQGPSFLLEAFTARLLRDPEAALIRYAVLSDNGTRHPHLYREQHLRLAEALGLTVAPGPGPRAAPSIAVAPGEHLGPYARALGEIGDAESAAALLAAYRAQTVGAERQPAVHRAATAGPRRQCCLTAIRGAIHALASKPDTSALEPVRRMSEQWWEAADDWERMIAVAARAAARDPADRALLLGRVDLGDPNVTTMAIHGLAGPGDDAEIAVLRPLVTGTEPRLRWARRAAVRRLRAIGGPLARAALLARPLDPVDPPWRDDRGWLAEHGDAVLPVLLDQVAEPRWWHEGPFALGELRSVAAVPVLCRLARSGSAPIPAVDALGRIGSREAVPTLLDLTAHPAPDVRDHALRALHRIGGPEATDAAVIACDDFDPTVRDRAARVLARHGDERAVTALIRLCDTVHAARSAAALARIGDPRALPALWHLFRTAPDRRTRHAAGRGLAAIDGPKQYVSLDHSMLHVRRAYVWLLGHKPAWKPGDDLLRALTNEDHLVRANAATSLARLGNRSAAEPVGALLDDPDPRVRAAAGPAARR